MSPISLRKNEDDRQSGDNTSASSSTGSGMSPYFLLKSVAMNRIAAFQWPNRPTCSFRFARLDDGKRCFWAQALGRRRSFTQSDVDFYVVECRKDRV